MRASDAPNGLAVRIDRFRVRDLFLRVWTMWRPDSELPAESHDTVLVHGLGVSSQYFQKVAVRLAEVGRVHLLDLPGFGLVPAPRHRPGIEGFADVVTRWAERTELSGAVMVGHSMGAQVVTEVLARRPSGVTHGVLIGPPVNASERRVARQALRLAQSSLYESGRTRRVALSGYASTTPAWFAQTLPGMLRFAIEERVRDVTVPLLVVHGARDAVCPPAWAELLADRAPQGRSELVPGAAHAVIYDHGEDVARIITEHATR